MAPSWHRTGAAKALRRGDTKRAKARCHGGCWFTRSHFIAISRACEVGVWGALLRERRARLARAEEERAPRPLEPIRLAATMRSQAHTPAHTDYELDTSATHTTQNTRKRCRAFRSIAPSAHSVRVCAYIFPHAPMCKYHCADPRTHIYLWISSDTCICMCSQALRGPPPIELHTIGNGRVAPPVLRPRAREPRRLVGTGCPPGVCKRQRGNGLGIPLVSGGVLDLRCHHYLAPLRVAKAQLTNERADAPTGDRRRSTEDLAHSSANPKTQLRGTRATRRASPHLL